MIEASSALSNKDETLRRILRAGKGPGVLLANVRWRSELWKETHQYSHTDYVEKYFWRYRILSVSSKMKLNSTCAVPFLS